MTEDLENVHNAMQELLKQSGLPQMPRMKSNLDETSAVEESAELQEEIEPSCDNSPRLSASADALASVPIDSLYRVTGLKYANGTMQSLPTNNATNDFISKGLINLEDADRLTNFYLQRLDRYMYSIGGTYRDLASLRQASPVLTACICTVAALHQPAQDNHLYGICIREFRRLVSSSMFDRRVDRDHLRAMCIGAYWLSDMSWTLSGYAIRRATEVNLDGNYHKVVTDNDIQAVDCMRLWYILYICDQHLSILYGRPSIIRREESSIQGWEDYLSSPATDGSDKRLISQVALLNIIGNVRELFGLDTKEPIPKSFASHMNGFSRQLDQWLGTWSAQLRRTYMWL